ncbi:MAG: N-acyl homoserine lactonase family protein [Gammaproteobacteria bacterium]|nr:N-acyl homoserine lactonase family protein [Gammaproteobacteria bacterium]
MTVKLYAMTCGYLDMPMELLIEGGTGTLRIPIPAYIIEHKKGVALFDSGMSLLVQKDKNKALGPLEPYFAVHFEPGEEVSARLAAIGRDASKVDFLINSHLHFDHAGGNALVPNARVIVQKKEWEAGHVPELIQANYYDPRDYDHGHQVLQVDGEYDVFGDGSLRCIPTHGHTPGHQSLHLHTESGEVVLCGDACYLRRTLDEMRLPGIVSDKESMMKSLQKLKDLQSRGAKIMYGHDPEFWSTVPQAPAQAA